MAKKKAKAAARPAKTAKKGAKKSAAKGAKKAAKKTSKKTARQAASDEGEPGSFDYATRAMGRFLQEEGRNPEQARSMLVEIYQRVFGEDPDPDWESRGG
jgi:hypothetical protein